tara:strand:- start:809 stop:2572 length:1764 start_codon:yes stop_codon:yes gene_type:complete
MAKRPEQSLDVLGQSLLSQQASTRAKEDRRRRKDRKRMMALGALVAGQSLVNSALERRVKEIKDNNTLDMQNARLYHKQIQKTSQLYNTFDGYDFKNYNDAINNQEFLDTFDNVYTPMFDRQLEQYQGKLPFSPDERNDLYAARRKELINDLIINRDAWRKGTIDFGKTNKELTLGSEADLNIHLTRLAKEQSRNLGGSVFSGPNLKALLSIGFNREGSVFDKTLAEQSPLKGLQATVNSLGFDKKFAEAVGRMRNSGRNWIDQAINNTEAQGFMTESLGFLVNRLKNGDPLLKNNPALLPFKEDQLPTYRFGESIKGGHRLDDFVGWLAEDENTYIKKQYDEYSTALYLKLKNERGFKEELLQTIGYEPGSKEFNELKSVLNNETELRGFVHSWMIQNTVTDNEEDGWNLIENEKDFSFDPTKIKHLLVNKIEVTKDGFNTTDDFDKSSIEERDNAIVDEGKRILESGLDPTKKSEVTEKLLEDVGDQTSTSKNELRERIKFVNVTIPSVNQEYISKEWQDKLERSAGDEFWSPIFWGAGNIASLQKYAEKGIKDSNLSFALSRHNLSDDASSQDVQKYLATYLES